MKLFDFGTTFLAIFLFTVIVNSVMHDGEMQEKKWCDTYPLKEIPNGVTLDKKCMLKRDKLKKKHEKTKVRIEGVDYVI